MGEVGVEVGQVGKRCVRTWKGGKDVLDEG